MLTCSVKGMNHLMFYLNMDKRDEAGWVDVNRKKKTKKAEGS